MTDAPPSAPGQYHCPACGALTTAIAPCPGCGRAPDPQAPRLVLLDREVTALSRRIESARTDLNELMSAWQARDAERRELARAMVTAVYAERAAAVPVTVPASTPVADPAAPPPSPAMPWFSSDRLGTSDASPRTVQNLLFVLGGVLLGIGSIVFTVFAWARFGTAGRVSVLALATLVALSIPVFMTRRALTATAETFAAIGLLLVSLDGYGVHRLNLLGVAERMSTTTYAALVLAILATIGFGYGRLVGLSGPQFVALAAIQPIPTLLSAAHHPDPTRFATSMAVLAAINFGIVAAIGRRTGSTPAERGCRVCAAVFAGAALLLASTTSLVSLVAESHRSGTLQAAVVVVLCAAILLTVSIRGEVVVLRAIGIAVAVVEIGAALARSAALAWPGHPLYLVAAVTLTTVVVALKATSWVRISAGATAAAGIEVAALGIASTLYVAAQATADLTYLTPLWHSDLTTFDRVEGVALSVPVAIVVAFGGGALLLDRGRRAFLAWLGSVPLVAAAGLLATGHIRPLWWSAPVVDAAAVVVLLAVAVAAGRRQQRLATAIGAASVLVLAIHAGVMSLARPALTASIVGALVLVALGTVVAFRRADDGDTTDRVIAGGALVTALLGFPLAVAASVAVAAGGPVAPMRCALGAAAVEALAVMLIRGRSELRWYAISAITAVTIVVSLTPLAVESGERLNLYAMTGRLVIGVALLAVGLRGKTARLASIPGDALGLFALGRIIPVAATVLLAPYAWLGSIWSGAPSGIGIVPNRHGVRLDDLDIATAVLFTASLAISGALWRGRRGAVMLGAHPALVAVLVIVAASDVPWPTLPIVALALGLAAIGVSIRFGRAPIGWTGLALAGAGLAGLTATRVSTESGLAAVLAVALFAGAGGRSPIVRAAGWCAAVASTDLLVFAALNDADAGTVALVLIGVAVLGFAGSLTLRRAGRAGTEDVALELVAHGTALVALVTAQALTPIALCGVVWGLVNGLAGRVTAVRAAGWCTAVAAADLLAYSVLNTHGYRAGTIALGLLGVAAAASIAAPALRRIGRDTTEVVAMDAVAHATALLALLTASALAPAAVCAAGWGLLLAVRAFWPDIDAAGRRALITGAFGLEVVAWWLIAIRQDIDLIEAYTLPAAAAALVAGILVARSRPELSSWAAYGTALVVAFLPSVAPTFGTDPHILRQFVVGLAAVGVALIGGQARLQAPVVVGGLVAVLLAVQDAARLAQHLPVWAPLSTAGLVVIVVASTYERRRRDWTRLRSTVGNLS